MIGVPSSVDLYWKTPPAGSSTTKSRSVIRTGLVSLSTGTSQGSVGHGGVGSGVGARAGAGVAIATGVGVASGTGALGLGPPPQDTAAVESTAVNDQRRDFIIIAVSRGALGIAPPSPLIRGRRRCRRPTPGACALGRSRPRTGSPDRSAASRSRGHTGARGRGSRGRLGPRHLGSARTGRRL